MIEPRATLLRSIDSAYPDPAVIRQAAQILLEGGLVAFPTETVYGLGANGLDAAAVRRIFDAKGRPAGNPLILHVAQVEQARALTTSWPDIATQLAERFWPGPLTLVLPRDPRVPDVVTAGGSTVALRMPAHSVARALIEAADRPVAAPSANRSTQLSPTTAGHVRRDLAGRIDLILDAGPTAGGLESTVLDLTTAPPTLLRPGLVSPSAIEGAIGLIQRGPRAAPGDAILRSPGLQGRHYAPRAPLELVEGDAGERIQALRRQGVRIGWLPLSAGDGDELTRAMPGDPSMYAAMLYAVLHDLDDLGVDRIVVALPPDAEAWLAVCDRLRRAAQSASGPAQSV